MSEDPRRVALRARSRSTGAPYDGDGGLPTDLESLRGRCDSGEEFTYLLFYGHTVPKGGKVGKTCLSQWYPAEFTAEGAVYRTAEHYMMAEKARLFGDEDKLSEILACEKPGQVTMLCIPPANLPGSKFVDHTSV